MSAFLICDVKVKDRSALTDYLSLSQNTLAAFGGKFHVQAGQVEVMEGDWDPSVIILAEFPSTEKALEWYHSEEYAPALQIKHKALDRNMIVIEN